MLVGAAACGEFAPSRPEGGARVYVSGGMAAIVPGSPVEITVRKGLEVVAEETLGPAGSGKWEGKLYRLPVGTYQIVAEVWDTTNPEVPVLTFGSEAEVDIAARKTVRVDLLLQQKVPPTKYENQAPVITSIVASEERVDPGSLIHLVAAAHDPDGDDVVISWTDSCRTDAFSARHELVTDWTTPTCQGDQYLTLTVEDTKGAKSAVSIRIQIAYEYGRGNVSVFAELNHWPDVTLVEITDGDAQIGPATAIGLKVHAADADGDPLTYLWSNDCGGTFGSPAAAVTTFTAPGSTASCKLSVKVEDGRGGTNSSFLVINVGPPPTAFAPLVNKAFQSAVVWQAGQAVAFRVYATDPQGGDLTYAWGEAGPVTAIESGGSQLDWTAPATCPDPPGEFLVLVTITSSLGPSTVFAFSLPCALAAQLVHDPVVAAGDLLMTGDVTFDDGAFIFNLGSIVNPDDPMAPIDPCKMTFYATVQRSSEAASRTLACSIGAASVLGGGKLDLVFVLDTTGSMAGAINGIKSSIHAFADHLLGPEHRLDVAYGLYAVGDAFSTRRAGGLSAFSPLDATASPALGEWLPPSFDEAERPYIDLTSADALASLLDLMPATGGGDASENYLGALQYARDHTSFRPGASRVFIAIGDYFAHTAASYAGKGWPAEWAPPAPEALIASLAGTAVVHSIGPDCVTCSSGYPLAGLSRGTGGAELRMPSGGNVNLDTIGVAPWLTSGYTGTCAGKVPGEYTVVIRGVYSGTTGTKEGTLTFPITLSP
jgi:hypothetical protein